MSEIINKYTDIIRLQSHMLTDSNQMYLSLAQRQAIELINRYAVQLVQMTTGFEDTTSEKDGEMLRHELINVLTPIVGYIEMLADGWIGKLNPDQVTHVEIIHQSVNALQRYLLSYQFRKDFSASA